MIDGPSTAFDLISINTNHGDDANNPLGKSAKVRQAFELSLDRNAINQVAYEGFFVPGNQPEPVGTQFYDAAHPVPERDVAKAGRTAGRGRHAQSLPLRRLRQASPTARSWRRSRR